MLLDYAVKGKEGVHFYAEEQILFRGLTCLTVIKGMKDEISIFDQV